MQRTMGIRAEAANFFIAEIAERVNEPGQVHVKKTSQLRSHKELLKLRRQLEWYLSDANLSTDQNLHHKISLALPEGWVCCSELLQREGVRDLGATPSDVIQSLKNSHLETRVAPNQQDSTPQKDAEVSELSVFVRRRQPLPPLLDPQRQQGCDEAIVDPRQLVLVDRHQTLNRLRDQWRVQKQLNLAEVGDSETVFCELLAWDTIRWRGGYQMYSNVIAIGYERIVYGDHGPYIEFARHQIQWNAWPHFFDKRRYNSYFDEYYTEASHELWQTHWDSWDPNPMRGVLLLYAQTRPVNDRPWAPGSGSSPHAGRPNGYADYRPGYFYVAADENLITATR